MTLPPGYNAHPNQVYRLQKSLYGFKQASRQWNAKFTSALLSYGLSQSKADYSLFVFSQDSSFMALLVYVDDIIVTSNDVASIDSLQHFLNAQFKIKSLGDLRYFLGLEVGHSQRGLSISQCNMRWTS